MQEKYIHIGGNQLMVARSNQWPGRPTIIFLHDSLGSIELWRDFPEKVGEATACNVLVYDRQGYGKSSPFNGSKRTNDYLEIEADVVNGLIKQLGIKHAILFGHSDGGSIALLAGAKYPSPILGIITEGAHIFVEDITRQGIREAVKAYKATNLKERLEKYHGEKTDAVFWAWANTWLRDEFRSWNIEHFLPHITCPLLVIQGENDEYGSLLQVNGIIHWVAGKASPLIIPSVGHTPHKEAKETVLEGATSFIHHLLTTHSTNCL